MLKARDWDRSDATEYSIYGTQGLGERLGNRPLLISPANLRAQLLSGHWGEIGLCCVSPTHNTLTGDGCKVHWRHLLHLLFISCFVIGFSIQLGYEVVRWSLDFKYLDGRICYDFIEARQITGQDGTASMLAAGWQDCFKTVINDLGCEGSLFMALNLRSSSFL